MAGRQSRDGREPGHGRGAYSEPPGYRQVRHRRRRPAPTASHTYQGEVLMLVYAAAVGVAGAVAGIVALVVGEVQGLLPLGGGCWAAFFAVWVPHRVTLDDSGVLLQAVVRRVRIPWEELLSVEPPWWDVRHGMLRWGRSRGLAVETLQAFPDLHKMLVEVERRSPKTYVSS